MIQRIMKENERKTSNTRDLEILKEYFPGCFHDGAFDLKDFGTRIQSQMDVTKEGYQLDFLGKDYARLLASLDTETVIVPDKEHNEKPTNQKSGNLYITGDNLDALKHLLYSYEGQVKCIYIDPPYNTGSDGFVYNDTFGFNAEELEDKLSISTEEAEKIMNFTRKGSASHSAWLTFMLPRLQLARDLLTDDGVIFISIDDNEQANLKLLCDSVFGEENFVAQLIWERAYAPKNDAKYISNSHDYVLMYARKLEQFKIGRLPRTDEANSRYDNPDNDPRGVWKSSDMSVKTYTPENDYPITTPSGRTVEPPAGRCWSLSKNKFLERLHDNRIYFGTEGNSVPSIKRFLSELKFDGMAPTSILFYKDVGHSQEGAKEVTALLHAGVFDGPKPVRLLKRLLTLANLPDDALVIDFFSGSGSFAQAVMEKNVEEQTHRHWILAQLNEKVKPKSEAEQKGFHTIDEIGRKRIDLAAEKIRKEHPDTTTDLGYQHFTLAHYSDEVEKQIYDFDPNLDAGLFADHSIYEEFDRETVLTTYLCRDGYGLGCAPKVLDFAGYTGFYEGKHLYLLDRELTDEAIIAICQAFDEAEDFHPEEVVLFGYNFTYTELDMLRSNLSKLKDTEKNLRIHFDVRY